MVARRLSSYVADRLPDRARPEYIGYCENGQSTRSSTSDASDRAMGPAIVAATMKARNRGMPPPVVTATLVPRRSHRESSPSHLAAPANTRGTRSRTREGGPPSPETFGRQQVGVQRDDDSLRIRDAEGPVGSANGGPAGGENDSEEAGRNVHDVDRHGPTTVIEELRASSGHLRRARGVA
jgi:hypothetical protein